MEAITLPASPKPNDKPARPAPPRERQGPPAKPPAPAAPRGAHPPAPSRRTPSRVVVPIRMAAWMAGDLGRSLERTLHANLEGLSARLTRLPRAIVVEADEEPGVLLEAVHRAARAMEAGAEAAYPVFYHEMGPVWTGTLQAVFH